MYSKIRLRFSKHIQYAYAGCIQRRIADVNPQSSSTRRRSARSVSATHGAEYKGKLLSIPTMFAICFVATTVGCGPSSNEQKKRAVPHEQLISRQYKISDIIHRYDSPDTMPDRIDDWVFCITANIESGNWNIGGGTIHADYGAESIRVRSTLSIHKRIDELLAGVREMQVMQERELKSQVRDAKHPNADSDVAP